jgi:hypothetical protein
VSFASFVGQEFIYMQNNGRPHIARVVSDYLTNIEIPVKEWPALDPDLNPIREYGKAARGTASKSLKSANRSTSGYLGKCRPK